MTWSDFYLICFLVGFGLSVLSLLAGSVHLHLPHLHFDHGIHIRARARRRRAAAALSWFNFGTIAAFLAWFGGTGYLLEHYYGVWFVVALGVATLSGLGGASVVFWFLAKVLMSREEALDPADYDMVGVLGKLSMPIRAGGTGEIDLYAGRHAPRCRRACEIGRAPSPRARKWWSPATRKESLTCARGMNSRATWRQDCGANEERSQVMENQVFVIAALMVLALLFLMMMFAKLFRKAGPHEAIIVYGFRGTRVVKGRGTVIFPDGGELPRAVAGADVVRRGAEAGPLHQAGRGGHGGSGGADQGEVAIRSRSSPPPSSSSPRRPKSAKA